MAGRIAYYGNTVTNGLVLSLDAAKRDSYPGSGNTWRDISGNGNNGTLTNGPTYTSDNGGAIVFDGTNDYATGSFTDTTILNTNAVTLEAWVYHTGLAGTVQRYVSTFPSASEHAVIRFEGGTTLRFYIVTTTGYKFLTSANQIYVNNWYHIVGTWDGTTQKLYKNNTLVLSSTQTGTILTGSLSYHVSLQSESMKGYIPIAKIYNRALSEAEIAQNYNAQKSRYGL